jgi:hypothetical protein
MSGVTCVTCGQEERYVSHHYMMPGDDGHPFALEPFTWPCKRCQEPVEEELDELCRVCGEEALGAR